MWIVDHAKDFTERKKKYEKMQHKAKKYPQISAFRKEMLEQILNKIKQIL